MTESQVPPLGISLDHSPIVQSPPRGRTVSVPEVFIGGWSGPMLHSDSNVHSPTSRCSQRCSFCGSGVCIEHPRSAEAKVDPVNELRYKADWVRKQGAITVL